MELWNNPEEVVKIFQAGGADSDLAAGGSLMEEEQETVWNFTRTYAVMLAPLWSAPFTSGVPA